ncbi:MAG: carbon starvation protein A, partial [Eubacterium sp.]|nr:carbon starvation protein A [Eubacterium sp.]
ASTFGSTTSAGVAVEGAALLAHQQTAMISILFIVLAIVFGFLVYRKNMPIGPASIIGVVGIIIIVAIGMNFCPVTISYNAWMWILGVYILIASVTPVWILLQPRDYLSSFLLYFMIAVAVIAVIGASICGQGNLAIPAFAGWKITESNGLFATGNLFPALFVTIACGAISGFHSLVSSGTTSKQIDNEANARPVAYGSMLIECVVAVISLCAVGFVWNTINVDKDALAATGLTSPTAVFAGGISQMIGTFAGPDSPIVGVIYSMFVLAVSVFCLTSLDTATRLARYMFQEFWLAPDETVQDVKGTKKFLCNPYFATIVTVVLGVGLGMTGYAKIWPLFGAANQLLAAVGLLAVCTWLGKIGKNNKMFYIPMVFMLIVTITSLVQTIMGKIQAIGAGGADIWAYIQAILAALLIVLAVVLAIYSFVNLAKQGKGKKAAA